MAVKSIESLVVGIEETAILLDVSKQTVYKLIREKKLPATKIGRDLKISRVAIRKLIDPSAAPLQGA